MPTLREVKKRIRSVKATKRITKAMEMVAAAKLRRAQQRVEQTRPYALKMDEMLRHLAAGSSGDISHPYFENREVKKKTIVIIASDRGLCGSFNANVLRLAMKWLRENDGYEREIVAIGKRVNDFFKRREYPIVGYWGDWSGVLDYDKAREIVRFLTERFVGGETDEISVLFTRFLSTVKYELTLDTYLPIEPPQVGDEAEEAGSNREYIFEPNPEAIYAALMPSYATTKMVTAIADSLASEHGSRMMAMGNATSNAGEMIDALTLDYNKARQGQITKELLEVVAGAEALRQ